MSDTPYIDSSSRAYETLPELVGHVVHCARMKIASATLTRKASAVQYFGKIPAGGITVVGATMDLDTVTSVSGGAVRVELGYPTDPDAFARWDAAGAGFTAATEKDIKDADAAFTDPVILAAAVAAGSPTVIQVKISEVTDGAGDTVAVAGFMDLMFIPHSQVSDRLVRDSNGRVDTARS